MTQFEDTPDGQLAELELSVVIPCLNEVDALGYCLEQVKLALDSLGIAGEIIVADNGSTDGSADLARELGARVVCVAEVGYGRALMAGIGQARGKYVIMGDADASYDFLEIPRFVEKLREGFDLVQGCRFPSGGGTILPGAMPVLHRWFGNPMFSQLARWWFRSPLGDAYCGLRGFSRAHYETLHLSSTGMEFAIEMVIKSSLNNARIAEIPVTLHPDRRQGREPHLRTFRDGWRTLRFFLMYSPSMLFVLPGTLLVVLGLLAGALALPGIKIGPVTFDAHTLLFGSLFLISGYQSILFGALFTAYAQGRGLLPEEPHSQRRWNTFRLERGLILGGTMLLAGVSLLGVAVNTWRVAEFGTLDYASTMRWVIPGVTFASLGFQTVLASFGLSILRLGSKA